MKSSGPVPNAGLRRTERVTIKGQRHWAMTACRRPGNSRAPRGFMLGSLGEDRSEMLVLRDGNEEWLESGDCTCRKCN